VKRSANTSNTRETYLRFNLDAAGTIESAVLRLHGGLLSSGAAVSVQLYAVSSTIWTESGITYTNKPTAGASAIGSASVDAVAQRWYEFDVTSYVMQQKAAGTSSVSFALKAGNVTDPQAALDSDEATAAADRPQLVVSHVPEQSLIVSTANLSVPEGSNKSFTVRLARKPSGNVSVSVLRQSGDADLSATPGTLTFTTTDWDQPKTITVSAAEDSDTVGGSAVFAVSSAGLPTQQVTATEVDNDTPAGPLSLRAVADTYVRDGTYAASNFGTATALEIKKNSSSGYTRETWLRFDLSSVASASSAKLRLYGKLSEAMTGGVTVTVSSSTNTTWSETALTWNTRPAVGTTTLASAVVSGTSSKWYEFDLANFVKSELAAGRKVLTLVLRSTTAANPTATFASDEAASNRPELLVT
jgi:hypothetical protein